MQRMPFDRTVTERWKPLFSLTSGANPANCQLLFASCCFCQRASNSPLFRSGANSSIFGQRFWTRILPPFQPECNAVRTRRVSSSTVKSVLSSKRIETQRLVGRKRDLDPFHCSALHLGESSKRFCNFCRLTHAVSSVSCYLNGSSLFP